MNDIRSNKIIKLVIGCCYLLILSLSLYFFFSNFTLEELRSYQFIQANREFFLELKENNGILLFLFVIIFTIIWVSLLGFGTPIALLGGFIFGKWIGTILVTAALSIGALCLYSFGKYFLYDFLKEKLFTKFKNLNLMFQKKQLLVMILFRFVGFVPFFLANLLPVIFGINTKNYLIGTFVGILPSIFIMVSLGSGFNDAIYSFNEFPSLLSLIALPEIYFPLIGFLIILTLSLVLKNKFK